MSERRKLIQDMYVRVCRDSGFQLSWEQATKLTAKVGGWHPLDVWMAMPSMDVMEEIAEGKHPASKPLAVKTKG